MFTIPPLFSYPRQRPSAPAAIGSRFVPTREEPLLFVHIPKTAGTAVHEFLGNRFPHGTIRWLRHDGSAYRSNRDGLGEYLCYMGHVPFQFSKLMPTRPRVLVLLRNPLERALSHYYYVFKPSTYKTLRRMDCTEAALAACHMTLEEWMEREPLAAMQYLSDLQTKFMSADYVDGGGLYTEERNLALAKENLEQCDFIGTTEELEDSLSYLCRALGQPASYNIAACNTTAARPKADQISKTAHERLCEWNRCDFELYEYAQQLMRQRRVNSPVNAEKSTANAFDLTFDQAIPGSGWHAREMTQSGVHFCWTEGYAWVEFPLHTEGEVDLCIEVMDVVRGEQLKRLKVRLDGAEVPFVCEAIDGGCRLRGRIRPKYQPSRRRLSLQVQPTFKPCHVIPGSADTRRLGIAVSRVSISAAADSQSNTFGLIRRAA